jgi:hypothetical protein
MDSENNIYYMLCSHTVYKINCGVRVITKQKMVMEKNNQSENEELPLIGRIGEKGRMDTPIIVVGAIIILLGLARLLYIFL